LELRLPLDIGQTKASGNLMKARMRALSIPKQRREGRDNEMRQEKEQQLLEDRRDLNKFGYAQELLRDMGGFSNFAISFSIISILTGAVSLYGHGLLYGGSGMMGFGWTLVALFVILIAASMSELAVLFVCRSAARECVWLYLNRNDHVNPVRDHTPFARYV
jgi:hypothetical protein